MRRPIDISEPAGYATLRRTAVVIATLMIRSRRGGGGRPRRSPNEQIDRKRNDFGVRITRRKTKGTVAISLKTADNSPRYIRRLMTIIYPIFARFDGPVVHFSPCPHPVPCTQYRIFHVIRTHTARRGPRIGKHYTADDDGGVGKLSNFIEKLLIALPAVGKPRISCRNEGANVFFFTSRPDSGIGPGVRTAATGGERRENGEYARVRPTARVVRDPPFGMGGGDQSAVSFQISRDSSRRPSYGTDPALDFADGLVNAVTLKTVSDYLLRPACLVPSWATYPRRVGGGLGETNLSLRRRRDGTESAIYPPGPRLTFRNETQLRGRTRWFIARGGGQSFTVSVYGYVKNATYVS